MHKINYSDDIDLSKTSRRGSFNKSKIPSEAVRSYWALLNKSDFG